MELSESKFDLTAGDTAELTVSGGSGSFAASSLSASVATAEVVAATVTVTAIGKGETTVTVSDTETGASADVKITVIPAKPVIEVPLLAEWFSGGVPDDTSYYMTSDTEEGLVHTCTYTVDLADGTPMILTTTSIGGSPWEYTLRPTGDASADQVQLFKTMTGRVLADKSCAYYASQMQQSKDDPISSAGDDAASFAQSLGSFDGSAHLFRAGFHTADSALEVDYAAGETCVTVRPVTFHDHWIWYADNFLTLNYNDLYATYFFSMASAGFMPPFFQISIYRAADRDGDEFNFVVKATPDGAISALECAYPFEDVASITKKWRSLLAAGDAEQRMGKFEQAVVFTLDNNYQTLATLPDLLKWIDGNDLSGVDYVMPIFRIDSKRVIIPQASAEGGLVLTINYLNAES